jgi:hypothetical protein
MNIFPRRPVHSASIKYNQLYNLLQSCSSGEDATMPTMEEWEHAPTLLPDVWKPFAAIDQQWPCRLPQL